jgi:hypothetical protein
MSLKLNSLKSLTSHATQQASKQLYQEDMRILIRVRHSVASVRWTKIDFVIFTCFPSLDSDSVLICCCALIR